MLNIVGQGNLSFRKTNEYQKGNSKQKWLAGAATAAILSPLIPIVDGDSYKSTYKNRNVSKFITGYMAVGGCFWGGKMLTDKYIDTSFKYHLRNAFLASVSTMLFLLVNDWSKNSGKGVAGKHYVLAGVVGAVIGSLYKKSTKNS